MRSKPLRRLVARLAIIALAFGQFAVIAHACPVRGSAALPVTVQGAPADAVALHPCSDMVTAPARTQTNVCKAHCTDSVTLPASPDLPQLAPMALPVPTFALAPFALVDVAARTPFAALQGAPPLTLRFCRLLI